MHPLFQRAEELKGQLISWRRAIHQNPEVGLDLPNTAQFVIDRLTEMGYQPKTICPCGIVALLEGAEPGPVILLRADMDALPMKEESGLPFASTNGCAHTCGHDTHTAMLLGAAKLLMENRDQVKGTVKFMFQPGEEGAGGAKLMLDSGVLERPKVDAAMGFHCVIARNHVPTGTIGYTRGAMMASSDLFHITVTGKGSHGAAPEAGIDPINILCHIHGLLQTINSREKPQQAPVSLTVGQLAAGDAANVIPASGFMSGTLRCFDEAVRQKCKRRIVEIAEGAAKTLGGSAVVEYLSELPATVNDPAVGDELFLYMKELVGEEHTQMLPPIMGSEDFSEVLTKVPGAFFRVSLGDVQEGYPYISHNPKALFNEDGMPVGSACFAYCAIRWLENHQND